MRNGSSPDRSSPRRRVGVAILAAALAAACADESSPLNTVPAEASAYEVLVGGSPQTGTVGAPVLGSPSIRVTDRHGNPVAGVAVAFSVVAGGGSVSEANVATGNDGEASTEWTLGTVVGENTLAAEIAGLETVTFRATARAGSPALIEKLGGDAQTDTVAQPLADELRVRVTDQYGNVIAGAPVRWTPDDGTAAVEAASGAADTAGVAAAQWTLGERSGAKRLIVTAGVAEASFSATALPDSPAELLMDGGDGQSIAAGNELVQPLVVRVVDAFGNGVSDAEVAWSVEEGDGSLERASSVTDGAGRSAVRYTVGTSPGTERVAARHGDFEPIAFTAEADEPKNLVIRTMYLTQSVQTADNAIPLVAGRDGVLRVFVEAEDGNARFRPDVVVRYFLHGTLAHEDTIPAERGVVPAEASESEIRSTWNLRIPGERIRDGLELVAEVDPADAYYEFDESDNVFPAAGALGFEVRAAPEFRVRLVPIHLPDDDATGDVTRDNMHDYLAAAQAMFPFPGYDVDVHAPLTVEDGGISTEDEWRNMLQAVNRLRVDEASDRYYYGVVPRTGSPRYCGLGYVAQHPFDEVAAAAVGLESCGAVTAAHEWGHNFGRRHVACQGEDNTDGSYPHPNGRIGVPGLDVAALAVKSADAHVDLMSYCQPRWISDYTYEAVREFRERRAGGGATYAAAPEPALVVSGRIGADGVELEPAFERTTRPVVPEAAGPYTLEGRAADGSIVFSVPFAGAPLSHGAPDSRDFVFALPLDANDAARLERVRLLAPGGAAAEIRRPDAAADLRIGASAERVAGGGIRVEWNAAAFPLAVIRDPASGEVLSLGRDGSVVVSTDAAELVLELSPGIGTVRQRMRVR